MEKPEPSPTAPSFQPLRVARIVLSISLAVGVGCVLLFAIALLTASHAPRARLEHRQDAVIVHAEFLGEYPTTVLHIRLMDPSTREVLFEVAAEKGTPQIHSFPLIAGENRVDVLEPSSGNYELLAPRNKSTFNLNRKTPYRLSTWGDLGIRRDVTIHF